MPHGGLDGGLRSGVLPLFIWTMLGTRGRQFAAWLQARGFSAQGSRRFGQCWQDRGITNSEAMAVCIRTHADEIDQFFQFCTEPQYLGIVR
eukprot:11225234-Lingulodinium_polyedra.AAC.1